MLVRHRVANCSERIDDIRELQVAGDGKLTSQKIPDNTHRDC